MKATGRVIHSDGEMAGFIVDGEYMGYIMSPINQTKI